MDGGGRVHEEHEKKQLGKATGRAGRGARRSKRRGRRTTAKEHKKGVTKKNTLNRLIPILDISTKNLE